jgi:hypothetical protein
LDWFADCVEENSLFDVPLANPSRRGIKRGLEQCGGSTGLSSSKPHTLAGSWLTLQKLVGTDLELAESTKLEDTDEAQA